MNGRIILIIRRNISAKPPPPKTPPSQNVLFSLSPILFLHFNVIKTWTIQAYKVFGGIIKKKKRGLFVVTRIDLNLFNKTPNLLIVGSFSCLFCFLWSRSHSLSHLLNDKRSNVICVCIHTKSCIVTQLFG